MATYLAQPPALCCALGSIHSGVPAGADVEIAGIPTYVARPPSGVRPNGHVVFYFPDIWGLANNARLLMDAFAAAGYMAMGMDYFMGDSISKYRSSPDEPPPPDFDMTAWRTRHTTFAAANVSVWAAAAKAYVRAEDGHSDSSRRYAAVGYCFGAPYVCELLTAGTVAAGAFAHPTQLEERHFCMQRPLFLSCAEDDFAFGTDARRRAVDILRQHQAPYHVQLFSRVSHGFASRGNLSDPYKRWAKEQSLQGIIGWFDLWLVQESKP